LPDLVSFNLVVRQLMLHSLDRCLDLDNVSGH
jgi:hypothetical protein